MGTHRLFPLIEALKRDATYGLRVLGRAPAFTVAAILSLALGIGANTAIFELLDAVRLRTLPVERPREIVEIRLQGEGGRQGNTVSRNSGLTNPLWEAIRDRQQSFAGVFAWGDTTFNLAPTGVVRMSPGLWVSGSFFQTLGVRPVMGRLFTPEDDRAGQGAHSDHRRDALILLRRRSRPRVRHRAADLLTAGDLAGAPR